MEQQYTAAACAACRASSNPLACDDDTACRRAYACFSICANCISINPSENIQLGVDCDTCGCNCAGPGTPVTRGTGWEPTPPHEDDGTWIVVVGVLVIIGGGLAIGAKTLGKSKDRGVKPAPIAAKKPKEKKEKKEKEETTRYILQLSTDKVRISPDSPAAVTVTTWKQVGTAAPVPAPEAAIELIQPLDTPEISIVPSRGTGSVEAVFSVRKNAGAPGKQDPRTMKIPVVASAEGTGTRAEIEIELTGAYSMEFY